MAKPTLYLVWSDRSGIKSKASRLAEPYVLMLRDKYTDRFIAQIEVDEATFACCGEAVEGWPLVKRLTI